MIELTKQSKERLINELKSAYELLVKSYAGLFNFKYANCNEFKRLIDDGIKEQCSDWEISSGVEELESFRNTLSSRASFLVIVKLLLVRIYEDTQHCKAYTNVKEALDASLMDTIGKLLEKEETQVGVAEKADYYKRSGYELLNPYDYIVSKRNLNEKVDRTSIQLDAVEESVMAIENIEKLLSCNKYNFKNIGENMLLGELYESLIDASLRKSLGQFYTPDFIIKAILENTLGKVNILENPFVKVLDPACGGGYFLLAAYDLLKQRFMENLKMLRKKYDEETYEIRSKEGIKFIKGRVYWKIENLHYHILTHCIYGADIDEFAVQLTSVSLLLKDAQSSAGYLNIVQCDSLMPLEKNELIENQITFLTYEKKECERETAASICGIEHFWEHKFDVVIGNPPYIGHKQLSMKYKRWLEKNYSGVFKDKSDVSYCFFQKALTVLKPGGRVGFITSRYFMESPTGRGLRQYLKEHSTLELIIDFCSADIFKGVGIASAIFILVKEEVENNIIKVSKLKNEGFDTGNADTLGKISQGRIELKSEEVDFESFYVEQELLEDERWVLVPEWQRNIYKRIQESCSLKLEDIVTSFQGVITGCDKAFIVDEEQIKSDCLESDLLKPWIKNSNVKRYVADLHSLSIIYSDSIGDEEAYPFSLTHIEKYRKKLLNRRECKKGIRKWYELQWGRNLELFLKDKIIYPYKAKKNRFAVDRLGCLCSADIYSFSIKEEYENYSLEYLCGVLNSKIYEFYFQLFAKKLGGGMYDYYPNSVLCLYIPDVERCGEIERLSKRIIALLQCTADSSEEGPFSSEEGRLEVLKEVEKCEVEINSILAKYFNLSEEEIGIICS